MWPAEWLARKLRSWLGEGRERRRSGRDRHRARGLPRRDQQYKGPFADGPWGDVDRAFAFHKRESTPRQHLNRRAQEEAARMGQQNLPWLDESSCTAVYEDWSVARLAELPRAHERDVPRDETTPVLILEAGGEAALLDGHTRVNRWAKSARGEMRRVVVIRPRDQVLNRPT